MRKRQFKQPKESAISSFFRQSGSTPSGQTSRPTRGASSDSREQFGNSAVVNDGFSTYSANGGRDGGGKVVDREAQLTVPSRIKVTRGFMVDEELEME